MAGEVVTNTLGVLEGRPKKRSLAIGNEVMLDGESVCVETFWCVLYITLLLALVRPSLTKPGYTHIDMEHGNTSYAHILQFIQNKKESGSKIFFLECGLVPEIFLVQEKEGNFFF